MYKLNKYCVMKRFRIFMMISLVVKGNDVKHQYYSLDSIPDVIKMPE